MGYRTYIGKISKVDYDKIKNLDMEGLCKHFGEEIDEDGYGYVGVYEMTEHLYEFGKYTEFDDGKFYKPFFNNEDLQSYYNQDHDLWIVGKDYLAHIINHYREKIRSYYQGMLEPFHEGRELNSKFLNSIETTYNSGNNDYRFDFSLITKEEQTALFNLVEHVRSFSKEWGVFCIFPDMTPYNLEKGDEVSTSWKYEYNIFELIRIYKTFDWESDIMVYYGY